MVLGPALDASSGFCWIGNIFGFQSTRFQTYLKGHGSVEFELECFSILPMYRQCIYAVNGYLLSLLLLVLQQLFCACVYVVDVFMKQIREKITLYFITDRKSYIRYMTTEGTEFISREEDNCLISTFKSIETLNISANISKKIT